MTTLERRLTTVARAVARMPPRPPTVDPNDFTDAERAALADLDARYGPLPRRADGRADLSVISDADLDTLATIARRLKDRGSA